MEPSWKLLGLGSLFGVFLFGMYRLAGRESLSTKRDSLINILNEEYLPQTISVQHDEELFALVADHRSVCVSTISGSVSNYKLLSLQHIWTLKLGHSLIQHCMTQDKVFIVTSKRQEMGKLFIIDRENGTKLHEVEQLHKDAIYGVRILESRHMLATVDRIGYIKFHQFS